MLNTPHFEGLTWKSGCELTEFRPLDYTYTTGKCRAQCSVCVVAQQSDALSIHPFCYMQRRYSSTVSVFCVCLYTPLYASQTILVLQNGWS